MRFNAQSFSVPYKERRTCNLVHVDGYLFEHAENSAWVNSIWLHGLQMYFEFDYVFFEVFWASQLSYYLTATLFDHRLRQEHGRLRRCRRQKHR